MLKDVQFPERPEEEELKIRQPERSCRHSSSG